MITISNPVLVTYSAISLASFLLRFFKDKVYKELDFKALFAQIIPFIVILIPFVCLYLASNLFGLALAEKLPYFLGAAFISYVLNSISLPAYLRGIIICAITVFISLFTDLAKDLDISASILAGLFVAKISQNILLSEKSSLDDVLPAFSWLAALTYFYTAESGIHSATKLEIMLVVISVATFLRTVQGPILPLGKNNDDPIFLKRLTLSITGGLLVLCALVKLLNLVNLQPLALLCGASFFIAYFFREHDNDNDTDYKLSASNSLKMLISIGLLTIVAARFFGYLGIIVLAPTFMVVPLNSAAIFPGLFFASRVFIEMFMLNFNQNVSGINITHPYVGAAQYAGFLMPIAYFLLLKENLNNKVLLAASLFTLIACPLLANYVLHEEASSSFFVACLVSSTIMAICSSALSNSKIKYAENIILLPSSMITFGILTSDLLSKGNESSLSDKVTVLSYATALVLVIFIANWFIYKKNRNLPVSQAQTKESA